MSSDRPNNPLDISVFAVAKELQQYVFSYTVHITNSPCAVDKSLFAVSLTDVLIIIIIITDYLLLLLVS